MESGQMSKLKIAVIIGSTRDARFGPKPAQWIFELARQRDELDVELVDLKEVDLPFFNEIASNLWVPSENPKAVAWQRRIAGFDGYIVVTPEYNRSMPASLKNALIRHTMSGTRSRSRSSAMAQWVLPAPSSMRATPRSSFRW